MAAKNIDTEGWSPDAARRYWEERAQRYAGRGRGLAAVCSYGMPWFYNGYIALTQMLALRPHLRVSPGTKVLDVGCGVGRYSTALARAGAEVTGVDLSRPMIETAVARAATRGLAARCRFLQGDAAELALGTRFDRIVVVTVLQHILDEARCREAIKRLAQHLAPGGTLVAIEAAPTRLTTRCDTAVFRAHTEDEYLEWFRAAGLCPRAITGVDPAPFKTWFLPHYRRLPRPLAVAGLFFITLLSLPYDLMFGRSARRASWHKVFVMQHCGEDLPCHPD